MKTKKILTISMAFMTWAAVSSNAGIVSYNDLSAFQADAGPLSLIDFNSPATDYSYIGTATNISGINFTAPSLWNGDTLGIAGYEDSYLMSASSLTITPEANTKFAGSELGAYYGNSTVLTATAYTLLGDSLSVNAGGATSFGFYGFKATGGDYITSIVLTQTSGSNYTAIDDFRWSVIPEPASIGLIGICASGIFFTRRIFMV